DRNTRPRAAAPRAGRSPPHASEASRTRTCRSEPPGWRVAVSDAEVHDPRRLDGIVVEALPARAAGQAGEHAALAQGRGRVARLAVLGEHDLADAVGRVAPHEVAERERAHGVAAAELHRLVDV